ncbi:hypothetical protein BH11MYX4_BH11MYX4_19900 [soil metagenome]
MLRTCAPIGAALAFCLATSACAIPSSDHAAGPTPLVTPEIEEPLALNVDDLDVRHGSLRIEASMLDGSADVSMWLGPSCAEREVGRGIATRAGFAWSLSGDDVARAIQCNLVVKAHGVDEDGNRVLKVASLDVSVSLVPDGADLVRLLRQQTEGPDTKRTFAMPIRARRLHIGGSVIGAEPEDEIGPRGLFISSFAVGNDDLARSMLHRRHVSVQGEHFLATVSVGPLTLDVSEPVVEEPTPVETSGSEEG